MYLQQIFSRLNWLLKENGYPPLITENIVFALEENVVYEERCKVQRSKLIAVSQFDSFTSLFAGGPSWIHANLVLSNTEPNLITIRVGSSIGNPHPSINASIEKREVEILG
jgi:hypothetical protein